MRALLIFLIIGISVSNFKSQSFEDFGVWIGVNGSYKTSSDITLNGGFAIRTNDNSTHVKQVFYQIGADYKVIKGLKTSLAYRNKFAFDYDGNQTVHRFIWDVAYKVKLKPINLQFRNRIQKSFDPKDKNSLYDRIRVKAKFKMGKGLKGFVYNEFFFQLNSLDRNFHNKNRWGLGMDYKVSDLLSVSVSYIRQNELNVKAPEINNVISAKLGFEF